MTKFTRDQIREINAQVIETVPDSGAATAQYFISMFRGRLRVDHVHHKYLLRTVRTVRTGVYRYTGRLKSLKI